MKWVLIAVLAAAFLAAVALAKAYKGLSLKELKRRARTNKKSTYPAVYKMLSYGPAFLGYLWILATVSITPLILIFAAQAWWLGTIVIILAAALAFYSAVPAGPGSWSWQIAAWCAPFVSWKISVFHFLFNPVGRLFSPRSRYAHHTKIYEKEDLLDLIKSQAAQPGNKIEELELKVAKGALSFGEKKVSSIMTPINKVKYVVAGDGIGPVLMDELHASGASHFPVVKEIVKNSSPQIIGSLELKDVTEHSEGGKVKDVMTNKVAYINEAQDLTQALSAFIKTHQPLLIVVNNFEEVSGVVSLEDVTQQILGQKLTDDFDSYHDLRAAAGLNKEPKVIE